MKRTPRTTRARAAVATAAALLAAGLGLATASTASATTSATTSVSAAPAYSSSSYVVASVGLNGNFGNGYVQLWYDPTTGDNWARLVSLKGRGSSWEAYVANTDNAVGYNTSSGSNGTPACSTTLSGSTFVACSPQIHSPVAAAYAYGYNYVGGTSYTGDTGYY
jgi:hypothetical protein